MDYFALLEIEKHYDIDLTQLNQQYLKMQSRYHPDLANDAEDKRKKIIIASDLNKAYTTLKDPIARAKYLLLLSGINADDSKIRNILPEARLQEFWDASETCENTDDLDILESLYKANIAQKDHFIRELDALFLTDKLQDALIMTISLKYLTNLISNIEAKIKKCK